MARIYSQGQAMGGSEISRPPFGISDHEWTEECPAFYGCRNRFPNREKSLFIKNITFVVHMIVSFYLLVFSF